MDSRLVELLHQLQDSENITATLENIKTLLSSIGMDEPVQMTLHEVGLIVPLFTLVSAERVEQELACGALEQLLDHVPSPLILQQLRQELVLGLQSPLVNLLMLTLSQCVRLAKNQGSALASAEDVLREVARLVGHSDTGVATKAAAVLKALGEDQVGALTSHSMTSWVQDLLQQNDTVACRILQVFVELSQVSPQHLSSCGDYLRVLVGHVQKDDVLVQLAALEMLSQLAHTPHTRSWLEEEGVCGRVEDMLLSPHQLGPLASLLLRGLMKFYGAVRGADPSGLTSRGGRGVAVLLSCLELEDFTAQLVAAHTAAHIGGTARGKAVLQGHEEVVRRTSALLHDLMRRGGREIKIKALSALATLVNVQDDDLSEVTCAVARLALTSLCGAPLDYLVQQLRQPDTEVSCGVLDVLWAAAGQAWAQALLHTHAALPELLLDRTTESTKEGKEKKFGIIQRLAESSTARDVFGAPYHLRLRTYVREGPFYVEAQTQVAVEEAQ